MACFIAPTTEAIVMEIVKHSVKKKETKGEFEVKSNISFSKKLNWLTKMLWGGSFLLAIEHIWHGEVTLYPPFLTAMNNAQDTIAMLHEIATTGVCMAVSVTAIWVLMVAVSNIFEKRTMKLVKSVK